MASTTINKFGGLFLFEGLRLIRVVIIKCSHGNECAQDGNESGHSEFSDVHVLIWFLCLGYCQNTCLDFLNGMSKTLVHPLLCLVDHLVIFNVTAQQNYTVKKDPDRDHFV